MRSRQGSVWAAWCLTVGGLLLVPGGTSRAQDEAPPKPRSAAEATAKTKPAETAVEPVPEQPRPKAAASSEGYPEMLTDPQERELYAHTRQELLRLYLPLLARPTIYKAVFPDPVPNHSVDWTYQREPVKDEVLGRQDAADRQSRGHAALASREVDRLWGERNDRRPEQLRETLIERPRPQDVIIELHRVQVLAKETYLLDYDVRLQCNGVWISHAFRSVDVVRQSGRLQLPSRLLEVSCQPNNVQGLAGTLINALVNP